MKLLENLANQLKQESIWQEFMQEICAVDMEFLQTKSEYEALLLSLGKEKQDLQLQSYVECCRKRAMAETLFFIGEGFRANWVNFSIPGGQNVIALDYSCLLRERLLGFVPSYAGIEQNCMCLRKELLACQETRLDIVDQFYSHFAASGWKVAHYVGYLLANMVLPYILPGYVQDTYQTSAYRMKLRNVLS